MSTLRLAELTDATAKNLDEHEFTAYAQGLYAFFWGDFCDWYVEASKSRLAEPALRDNCLAVQDLVLRQFLLLLHPVAPFITEELWHLLGYGPEQDFIQRHQAGSGGDLLRVLREHGVKLISSKVADVAALREFVAAVRALKSQGNQATRRDSLITVVTKDTASAPSPSNSAATSTSAPKRSASARSSRNSRRPSPPARPSSPTRPSSPRLPPPSSKALASSSTRCAANATRSPA